MDAELRQGFRDAKGSEGKRSQVAILCAPLYNGDARLGECLHWIPGWRKQDIDSEQNVEDMFQKILADAEQQWNRKLDQARNDMDALQIETDDDPVLQIQRESLEQYYDTIDVQKRNLLALLTEVYEKYDILARPTEGDGNCGIYTAIAFVENGPVCFAPAPDLLPQDQQAMSQADRKEFQQFWRTVSGDLMWQQVLERFIQGRVDLSRWKRELFPPATTPDRPKKASKTLPSTPVQKRKRDAEAAFTPDSGGAGALLKCGHGSKRPDSVTVVASQPAQEVEEEAPKKKKPTGKRVPFEQSITFEKTFVRFLAEKGFKYTQWVAIHARNLVIVRLA